MNKKYHILYRKKKEDFYSEGVTVEAPTPMAALDDFLNAHPLVIFLGLYSVDDLQDTPINNILNQKQS